MILSGGYTKTEAINDEAKKVFDEAMNGLVGVGYTPLAFATQVVNGTMYRFFCSATLIVANPTYYDAYVYIYAPTSGPAVIHEIHQI